MMFNNLEEIKKFVKDSIISGNVINAIGIFDPIPPRKAVRTNLSKPPIDIFKNRTKVIFVEDIGNYRVYIWVPPEDKSKYKSEYDFIVWRAIFDQSGEITDLKIPTHDDLGKMYLNLRKKNNILNEYLINATIRFIRDRWPIERVLNNYFSELLIDTELVNEIKKFLLTLKWIAIQEDANYPPPHLGSLYTLSIFAILEIVEDLSAIRKVIRFKCFK